jgi:hypothetical protein
MVDKIDVRKKLDLFLGKAAFCRKEAAAAGLRARAVKCL